MFSVAVLKGKKAKLIEKKQGKELNWLSIYICVERKKETAHDKESRDFTSIPKRTNAKLVWTRMFYNMQKIQMFTWTQKRWSVTFVAFFLVNKTKLSTYLSHILKYIFEVVVQQRIRIYLLFSLCWCCWLLCMGRTKISYTWMNYR